MLGRLQSYDLFRHVPKDLTEATRIGGAVSICAVFAILTLCLMELQAMLAIRTHTRIQISHREDDFFRINLNVTFPAISCSWLTVDYLDIIGHRKVNISGGEVHKHTLHGAYVASAVRDYDQPKIEYAQADEATTKEIAVFHEEQGTKVIAVTEETFKKTISEHRLAIVNFYAPWCPYCVALAPIFEQVAALVYKQTQGAREIVFATVNCVDKDNFPLCRAQHIQVFPTIRIFRDGSNNPNPTLHMHEEYRGPRTANTMAEFVMTAWSAVRDASPPGALGTARVEGTGGARAADGRRAVYSEYATFGCIISGSIKVSRIPGTILFLPTAEGHNFHTEAINVSHVINHLSFGSELESQSKPKKKSKRSYQTPDGAYAGDQDGTLFLSLAGRITHEHFLKVVQSVHEYVGGQVRETYEYTVNSNLYQTPPEDLPAVKLVWDIWPMEVVTTDSRRPLVEGICQLAGLLGGVYAAFLMFERFVSGTWRELSKARQGKLG